jgi:aspartyl-tRNA(Asn)/glutamyl-tRNA(Gln) amidotransferase subunit B
VRAGGAHRPRPQGADQPALGVRPEELFLSRPAAGLPDQPVQAARSSARARSSSTCRRRPSRSVGIERLHLEQDAGKSLHDQHPTMSFVDLNRSGVALMEIVSKPDMRSADEAKAYVTKLRTILRYLGTCDGNMEKGSCAPTSTSRCAGRARRIGTRCEIKNVNSIRFIGQAIEYEARRQIGISRTAARSIRKPACSIPARARRARCARRKRRTTTATSPIPTCCRSNSTTGLRRRPRGNLPELPDEKKARFIATTACRPMTPAC